MNYTNYRKNSSPATKASVVRLKTLRKRLIRDFSPLRGFLNKYLGKDEALGNKYSELCDYIKNFIRKSTLPEDVKESLYVGEDFQSQQKGPAAPLTTEVYDKNIIGDILVKDYTVAPEMIQIVESVFLSLTQYLRKFVSIDVLGLRPDLEWDNLPNTTIRGYPFNTKGSQADDDIKKLGGNSVYTALKYYESSEDFICFGGFRVQGKSFPGPAKLRLVYIPPVHSQYLDNALISESMRQLKACPIFTAGMEKEERDVIISNQNKIAHERGITRIQLDGSKFDKHIHPIFQALTGKYFHYVSSNGFDILDRRYNQYLKFRKNQVVLLANERNIPTFYKVPYQLPSGEKRTQHDGSLIGLILQGVFYKILFGSDIPGELTNQAGDDALWPVPSSFLAEGGYQGLLEKVSEINAKLGFELNPNKAYPNTDGAFLQKLYSHEKRITGVGSFTRSLASFIWKEKFSTKIKGVERLGALEIVSQITILSEPFSKSVYNIHDVAEYLVNGWLSEDDRLVSVIQYLEKFGKLSENELFKLIIKLTQKSFSEIFEYLDIESYDHKNLSQALVSEDYAKVFPVLKYLVKSEVRGRRVKPLEHFAVLSEDYVQKEQDDSDIGEGD